MPPVIETFDSPGFSDWTVPDRVHSVKATVISGGGGFTSFGSQGGHCVTAVFSVAPGTLIRNAVLVAASQDPDSANDFGGVSGFFTDGPHQLQVYGGACHKNMAAEPAAPGDPYNPPGTPFYTLIGGTLVSAYEGGFGSADGGGGSSAGPASNGGDASGAIGGTPPWKGGAGGNNGMSGAVPGGGAGANGTGARGRVILEYTPEPPPWSPGEYVGGSMSNAGNADSPPPISANPSAKQLISGYWGVNPSPVVEAYAAAGFQLTSPDSGASVGVPPAAWVLDRSKRISPGPGGRPTYGYPAPKDNPVWVALSLVGGPVLAIGPDFTISEGYVWFERDPFFDAPGRLELSDGSLEEVVTIWYGTATPPPPKPATLDDTSYALARAIADATDTPASGPVPETVVDIWQAGDGSWRVITDKAAYRLSALDQPVVTIGDVLAPGSAIGSSWALDKIGPRTKSDYVTVPAEMSQVVVRSPVTWYAEQSPIDVDTVGGRTRVRFRIGCHSADDANRIWAASMSHGVENGRTLAQALDTRGNPVGNPVGDPDRESLPTVVSPMELLAKELFAGCAYRLILRPNLFGPNGASVAEVSSAARTAAGSYATVIVWIGSELVYPPIDPPPATTTTTTTHGPGTTTTTTPPPGTTTTTTHGPYRCWTRAGEYDCAITHDGTWTVVGTDVYSDLTCGLNCPPTTTTTTTPPPGAGWWCVDVTEDYAPGFGSGNCIGNSGVGRFCGPTDGACGCYYDFPCGPPGTVGCVHTCGGGRTTVYTVVSGPHASAGDCDTACSISTTTTTTPSCTDPGHCACYADVVSCAFDHTSGGHDYYRVHTVNGSCDPNPDSGAACGACGECPQTYIFLTQTTCAFYQPTTRRAVTDRCGFTTTTTTPSPVTPLWYAYTGGACGYVKCCQTDPGGCMAGPAGDGYASCAACQAAYPGGATCC